MNIWNLSPISIAFLFFVIDFVAMIFIRIAFEKKFYLRRWWTFRYGDSIFLPMYGFFAANILHGTIIQASTWESIGIVFLGVITMLETEFLHVEDKIYKINQELLPSQIYHGFIFVIMFYIVGSSLPYVFFNKTQILSHVGVVFALAGYTMMVLKDYTIKKAIRKRYKKRKC